MFDSVIIGSRMSGGIAAKELCERGLKVLVLERGRKLEHVKDYTDSIMPWEFPNANMIPEEELARDYPIQSQCYAVNEATRQFWVKDSEPGVPGLGIHEMGTARMGRDPMTSVLNGWNQAHEAPNLFCTDGAAMASSGWQNPSLAYMALTARAADYATKQLRSGNL